MTSLYYVAFWSWLKTTLCCPAPAGLLMAPAVSRKASLSARHRKPLFHFFLSLSLCLFCFSFFLSFSSKPGCSIAFFCPLSCSPPPLSLSLLTAHSSLCSKPSGLCSYIPVQAICWREVSYGVCFCVCVLSCSFGDLLSFTLTAFVELMDHGIVSWDTFSVAFIKKVGQENILFNRAGT